MVKKNENFVVIYLEVLSNIVFIIVELDLDVFGIRVRYWNNFI